MASATQKVSNTPGSTSSEKEQLQSDIDNRGLIEGQNPVELSKAALISFRSAVGKLQLLTGTRRDILFPVKELVREVSDLQASTIVKLNHLLRYLKRPLNLELAFVQ